MGMPHVAINDRGHARNHLAQTLRVRIPTWHELWPSILENENHQIDTRYHGQYRSRCHGNRCLFDDTRSLRCLTAVCAMF